MGWLGDEVLPRARRAGEGGRAGRRTGGETRAGGRQAESLAEDGEDGRQREAQTEDRGGDTRMDGRQAETRGSAGAV